MIMEFRVRRLDRIGPKLMVGGKDMGDSTTQMESRRKCGL